MNNIIKWLFVFGSIASIVLSSTVWAASEKQSEPKQPEAAAAAQTNGSLKAGRKGDKVTLTWTLPEGNWRRVEIIRNDKPDVKNRKRVKVCRRGDIAYVDTISDTGKQYWYWLKLFDKDNAITNIGPVKAEE
ncbi:hypothetical protein OH491_12335 [Termitidicoccus mucosus]